MTPSTNGNSWTEAGPAFDLSDQVSLRPHGNLNVGEERHCLGEDQEAFVPDEGGYFQVRFSDGRWSYRRGEQIEMRFDSGAAVRISRIEEISFSGSQPVVAAPGAPTMSTAREWPRWTLKTVVRVFAAIAAVAGLLWLLVRSFS